MVQLHAALSEMQSCQLFCMYTCIAVRSSVCLSLSPPVCTASIYIPSKCLMGGGREHRDTIGVGNEISERKVAALASEAMARIIDILSSTIVINDQHLAYA